MATFETDVIDVIPLYSSTGTLGAGVLFNNNITYNVMQTNKQKEKKKRRPLHEWPPLKECIDAAAKSAI